MKRKIIVLLMVCAMLSACSGQTAPTAAPASEPGSSESSSEAVSAPESSEPTASTIERIDLASDEFSGLVGDSFEVSPTMYPTMVKDTVLEYSSTDESVVTVDENGSGTLVGTGSAEIVVTDTGSGVEARFAVVSQAVPQTSKPTGGTQAQTQTSPASDGTQGDSGGSNGTGGSGLPKGGYVSDEEIQRLEQETYGMTRDELMSDKVSDEEYNEILNNIDWGY